MNKTALVLHYNPVNLYPPAESGIRFLQQRGFDITVVTTQVYSVQTLPKLLLFSRIVTFNLRALWSVARRSIDLLVVYEHLSIIPVKFCQFWHPRCKVWVHFHEYSSPVEVKGGGFYSRYCWSKVAKLMNEVSLYTQTNSWRLKQFQIDFDLNKQCVEKGDFIPNTPPQSWIDRAASGRLQVKRDEGPLRMVYHGAVHAESTYIVELYRILRSVPGKYRLDIYSRDEVVEGYNEDVQWHNSIPFKDLAVILPDYDIGLILYKGHIPNYVHNVPNKFWEYVSCGLKVIAPVQLELSLIPKSFLPLVQSFDFEMESVLEFNAVINSLLSGEDIKDQVQCFEELLARTFEKFRLWKLHEND